MAPTPGRDKKATPPAKKRKLVLNRETVKDLAAPAGGRSVKGGKLSGIVCTGTCRKL